MRAFSHGGKWLFFGTALLVAVLATLPLRLLPLGLAAQEASGSLWGGRLTAAQWGSMELGDMAVAVQPLPLLGGRVVAKVRGPRVEGTLMLSGRETGVTGLRGQLVPAGLPLERFEMEGVEAVFAEGQCVRAAGQLGASLGATSSPLTGDVQCAGAEARASLASADGTQRLELLIGATGGWKARLTAAEGPELKMEGSL
jgi:hypothetical protein